MDIVLDRRTVRNFDLNKNINLDTLKYLCKCAESAPTARKQVSREYIIITNKEIINKLDEIYVKSTMKPSKCNAVIAIIGKNPDELPCPLFQPTDLALAVENILIKAAELGIGGVMLGTYPDEERTNKANLLLNMKDNKFVFTLICLGYPLEDNVFFDSNKIEKTTIEVID